ncbi:hypothetical protein [Halomonas nitroreducens]|uniref:YtxH domain-containing protein n=1 Tax=Halomonas nitroreducens TaxID=447425 RepID=A0A431V4P3_9GAMM|nr:hypothetical protein [Halomonas nitroreducens]RTR03313.1 hypothetical protein EKG36_10300 [Halomonas nitroreducens]
MKLQLLRTFALSLLIGMMAMGLAACEDEGPAEQAGENVDEAMEEAGESVEEMGENVEEAAEESSY